MPWQDQYSVNWIINICSCWFHYLKTFSSSFFWELCSLFNAHFKSSLCYRTFSGLPVFFSSILCSDLGRANCYGFWAPLSMESLVRALGINSLSISAYFSPHPSYASLHEGCGFPSQPLLCVKERSSQTWVKLKGHPWEMTRVMQMLEMTVICLLLPILVLHQRPPDAFPECGEVLRWGLKSHSLCFGFELADAAEITSILTPPPFPVCLPIVSRSLDSICPLGLWMTFLWPF